MRYHRAPSASCGSWSVWAAHRSRIRLVPDELEVRRYRTRTYRWAEIESVEVAPGWDGASSIWLRLRDSVPQAAPEVLRPPGLNRRNADGQSLDDIVAMMQSRMASARTASFSDRPG